PRPWVPGKLSISAMLITIKPREPTLQDFAQGRIELQVEGDPARTVDVKLHLLDETGNSKKSLPVHRQQLPLSAAQWKSASGHALASASGDLDVLASGGGLLVVDADDLGQRRIPLQHTPAPIRWLFRRERGRAELRLVNDSDDESLDVRHFRC